MVRFALPAIAGLCLPAFLPHLLPLWVPLAVSIPGVFLYVLGHRGGLAIMGLALGLGVGLWHGYQLVDTVLDEGRAGKDITVVGRVVSEVERDSRRARFLLRPERPGLPPLLQVSWYGAPDWLAGTGQRLRVTVRLKAPRSFINPAGFDYRLWQLRRGVGALGYVRDDPSNGLLGQSPPAGPRAHLRSWLLSSEATNRDVLRALLLGERDDISDERWQLFRHTGTSHLIAISGLHIGLAAGIGYLLGLGAGRLLAVISPVRAHWVAIAAGACVAGVYSALAGFSLPTQRALAMLLLFYLARLAGRHWGGMQILLGALLVVLAAAPLSVFDAGLWLSFSAVFALLLAFGGLRQVGRARLMERLWRPQWVVFIGLLVPLSLFFGQWSWLSPLANVVAITLVSVWVVPLLFSASLLSFVFSPAADVFLGLADVGLSLLWVWLEALVAAADRFGPGASVGARLSSGAVLLMVIACLLWLLPAALKWRSLALVLAATALLLPPLRPAPLSITAMDVGQGLAIVVRAPSGVLVYDTGPWFGPSFNAGADIIAPYLAELGVASVSALVVSHAHSDHAGGAPGLVKTLPVRELYLGEGLKYLPDAQSKRAKSCRAGNIQTRGNVTVRFVALPGQRGARGNNASCIVLLQWRDIRVLFPGDIERELEPALARRVGPVDVLVAPHHGSLSSSTAALVESLDPREVIFSTGFNNRHGHPHPEVVARYRRQGSRIHNTAQHGAVRLSWSRQGELTLERWRHKERRYWRE